MVGYTPYKQAVEVPASSKALGKIAITQGVEVGDVVIEVQKPLVMADAEKTTYSVEDDPQASTSTLDEIIRKVPQLSLDGDGNVLLNGQSNYKILLNGRNSATMSNNFKDVIQSMPASQISRIEVITNPSTKYEAEGVGGIINLITQRKKQFHGYNGSVGASVTVLENPAYNGNASLSIQAGKFAASIMGYAGYYDGGRTPRNQVVAGKLRLGEPLQPHLLRKQGQFALRQRRTGHELPARHAQPDHAQRMAVARPQPLQIAGYERDPRPRNEPAAGIRQPQHPEMELHGRQRLDYEHTFDKEGHTLTISDEVEIDPDKGHTDRIYNDGYNYRALQDADNRMTGNTVQVDYANPLSEHHKIEAGLKHIYRNSTSDTDNKQSDEYGTFPIEK